MTDVPTHAPQSTGAAIRSAARRLDALPLSPSSLGEKLLGIHRRKRRARAQADPEWAAIEARRGNPDSTYKTFLSDDLTWDDWHRQTEIARTLTPAPRWLRAATVLADLKLSTLAHLAVRSTQRATRGWADSDTWNLGGHLALTVGEQLTHLATNSHGWPSNREFPTFDTWTAALATHGKALTDYAHDTDDEALADDARAALHWVADHLDHLWD